jgi:GNAT superfamily N-acetyltransferase
MNMHYQLTALEQEVSRLHRAYRNAKRSKRPIAVIITGYDAWYMDREIFHAIIPYFTEQGEDISDQLYLPERRCWKAFAKEIRREKTCVVVETMIRVEDDRISRFSIRNLETTHDLVHDCITCIALKDRWALPKITKLLAGIGFHVVSFGFQGRPGINDGGEDDMSLRDAIRNQEKRERSMNSSICRLSDSAAGWDAGCVTVPTYLNGVVVHETCEPCEYQDTKTLLCPGCLKAVTFGRDTDAHPYVNVELPGLFDKLDRVSTPRGFSHHTRRCPPAFPLDGIARAVTEQQRYIVKQFARLSKRDAGWDFPLVDDAFFENDVGTVFVYARDRVPVSYVAFRRQEIPDIGSTYLIWDLFTLRPFRRQGVATAVLDHGIRVLQIDRASLPVSLPCTAYSKRIIQNASTNVIVDRWGHRFSRETGKCLDPSANPDS